MMKQKLIARLVLSAIAGLAAVSANAGQIQASSVSIAREVITSDTQTIVAPSIAYRFSGDVDARVQSQTFQVQFTLDAGEWAAAPTAAAISLTDGVSAQIQDQVVGAVAPGANSCGAGIACNASYQVSTVSLSADKKTMWATLVVNQGAAALVKQPLISVNVTSNTIAGTPGTPTANNRGTVTKLFTTVVKSLPEEYAAGQCTSTKTLPVSFKHYVALSNPAAIATDSTATPDEHTRNGSTNAATLIVFPTNIKVNLTSSTGGAILEPGGNLKFKASGVGNSFVNANTVMLGNVSLAQNALGYDNNLNDQYLLAGRIGETGLFRASGVGPATRDNGVVEVNTVTVQVTASQGFAVGSTLSLHRNATCSDLVAGSTTPAVTAATAAGPITVSVPNAEVNTAFGASGIGPVYVCYTVNGANTIPSSAFSGVATVVKSAGGNNAEQNNMCNGVYYALGGGLKIDVRNYASSAEKSGYVSVLRFINNSDSAAADVWGQIIHQDGKLGKWGKIADIPVRGVLNMTAAQIEAKLTSAPTAAIGPNDPVAQDPTATTSGAAPRLRITSQSGKSLRIQNYLFNSATGQILEASGQQGVDFEGADLRAPVNEGQYQDQDANSGLNLAK